jgi:hypothetical protein
VTVVLCTLNLPWMNAGVGPSGDADAIPTVRSLVPQLASLRKERGVLIDLTEQRFAEPYSVPVMVELQRLGVPWFVDEPGLLRQVGPSRTYDGQASARLFIREGDRAREAPPGTRRVAFVDALTDTEADELASIKDELTPFIVGGGLVLHTGSGTPGSLELSDAQLRDADYLLTSRALVGLLDDDQLDVPEGWADTLARYRDLQYQADRLTVGVFVEPLGTSA